MAEMIELPICGDFVDPAAVKAVEFLPARAGDRWAPDLLPRVLVTIAATPTDRYIAIECDSEEAALGARRAIGQAINAARQRA